MVDLRIMLRKLKQGMSEKALSQEMGLARSSIRVYKERLSSAGVDYETALKMDDAELNALLTKPAKGRPQDHRMAELGPLLNEYASDHKIRYRGYDIIWGDYIRTHPDGYSYNRFREILSHWEKEHNYTYHNVHLPGDEMQIDFAGDSIWLFDKQTDNAVKKVVTLCCLLPCSSLSFVYALPNATMEWMFLGLSKSLEYFGGVPARAKSDNMAQWVKRADRYEPEFTETAKQWGLHYGCALEATRVRKPRDKGAVESLVYQAYRYIYGRMSKEKYYDIDSLNGRMMELLDEFNSRQMSGRPYSRLKRFEAEEKAALMPLPSERFVYRHRKEFTLNSTYHVQISPEGRIYSVPYQYVGKECVAVYDAERVDIYHNYRIIATHKRVHMAGESTEPSHMPPDHREWKRAKECNADTFRYMASLIGPNTQRVMVSILTSKPFPTQTYKSCHGILNLGKRYGNDRLEAACRRVGAHSTVNYGIIKGILEKGLDREPMPEPQQEQYMPDNDSVRGPQAYV